MKSASIATAACVSILFYMKGVEAGGFLNSCIRYAIEGPSTLYGACWSASFQSYDAQNVESWLDLNDTISNVNGQLTASGSGYLNACRNCGPSSEGSVTLACECLNAEGTFVRSELSTNEHVSNSNGRLVWDGI